MQQPPFLYPAKQIAANLSTSNAPYEFQLQGGPTSQQQLSSSQTLSVPAQQAAGYQVGRAQPPGSFNMSGMAVALPEYQSSTPLHMSHQDQHRYLTGSSSGASAYQSHQFSGHPPVNTATYPIHPSQYTAAYQQGYAQLQPSHQSHSDGPSPTIPAYPGGSFFPAQQQPLMYYAGQPGQTHCGSYHPAYSQGIGHAYGKQGGEMHGIAGKAFHSGYSQGGPMPYSPYGPTAPYLKPGNIIGKRPSPAV